MNLQERYASLDRYLDLPVAGLDAVRAECLLAFEYDYPGSGAEVEITTDEFSSVGIVQEHAANRILEDLVRLCDPVRMSLKLDYQTRGGIHTVVRVQHQRPA